MTKEMYVSSTPHETKVAVVEDDQLAEIFYERENEYTLAGSIYKGRVTRVLPGMQSAFVDIGLERDAFLYVSDFLDLAGEDEEDEFEPFPTQPETYVTSRPQAPPKVYDFQRDTHRSEPVAAEPTSVPIDDVEDYGQASDVEAEETEGAESEQQSFSRGRRRRRGRRGRGFPESKFDRGTPQTEDTATDLPVAEDFKPTSEYHPIVLPGESISKYRQTPPNRPEDAADQGDRGSEAFVIEGGFDDGTPEFETQTAQKQFAEPEGPVHPPAAPETLKQVDTHPGPIRPRVNMPFVLPGETIAKYKQPTPEPTEELENKVLEKASETPAPELAAPPAPPAPAITETNFAAGGTSSVSPFVLPGESIAKYRPKQEKQQETVQEPIAPATGETEETQVSPREGMSSTPERQKEEPRTEVRMERRSPVAPFVLPGESIAKYRRIAERQQKAVIAQETEEKIAHPSQEELAQQAAEMVSDNEPLPVTLEREIGIPDSEQEQSTSSPTQEASSVAEHEISDFVETTEPIVSERGAVGGTTEAAPSAEQVQGLVDPLEVDRAVDSAESATPEAEPQPESRHEEREMEPAHATELEPRFEQMNVASTFGGDAAEKASDEDIQVVDESADEIRKHAVEERHGYSASAGHTLEEEEIDDEEADYRGLPEEDEASDYVELEERSYERGGDERRFHAEQLDEANGLTDAVQDAALEEETTDSAYPEHNGMEADEPVEIEIPEELAEEEFEESELEAEEAEEEQGTALQGRAQAAVGSGYPQRSPRPDFDRRGGRGRRGGRRMRGGPRREHPRPIPQISELLKEGQEVLIQIAKEPIGKKGARITSHIALPGRYLVYMPTVNHIGVSRKITSDEERQRLKRIMLSEREGGHGGFIVRTAAEGITEEELRADIRFLKNLWADIRSRTESSKAPALIYHDLNLVERVLRDQVTADFSSIWVDTEQEYERILRFANRFQPQLVRKVKLYTKNTPLYEQFGIQSEIDKALKSKVWLKSGGYIVINQTEALVAIDVNTGKYVGKTARLEDTIVKTNVDAIKEIVRQIRLRDLGGIIVVDFIDMDERKNRHKVMQALEEAMRSDRAPSKVLAFNDFGLVAITRKRVKQSLERTLGEPCPYCTGTGLVKSLTTMCNEIFVEMRKMARHLDREDVVLRVNPEIAKALKANGGKWVQEMEELIRRTIIVKSDPLLHQEHFDIQG